MHGHQIKSFEENNFFFEHVFNIIYASEMFDDFFLFCLENFYNNICDKSKSIFIYLLLFKVESKFKRVMSALSLLVKEKDKKLRRKTALDSVVWFLI